MLAWTFGDGRFCVQLCIETLRKRATSVAHLTNCSFEFFYDIFTEDASQRLLYHGAKKSKMTKNSNQGGGSCLNPLTFVFVLLLCHLSGFEWFFVTTHLELSCTVLPFFLFTRRQVCSWTTRLSAAFCTSLFCACLSCLQLQFTPHKHSRCLILAF